MNSYVFYANHQALSSDGSVRKSGFWAAAHLYVDWGCSHQSNGDESEIWDMANHQETWTVKT